MKQKKKCKGINKAHGFDGCGELVESKGRKYGLCPSCFWDWMQNNEAGKIHYQKQFLPKSDKVLKKNKKIKDREIRESLKSIKALIGEARVPFQKWIRLRDANDACISCGTTTAKLWHAGHFLKAELFTGMIFNEMNCNKQCEKCNIFLSGNEAEYRKGMVKKYGNKSVLEMEEASNHLRTYKFDREEVKSIKLKYQQKLKETIKHQKSCKHN